MAFACEGNLRMNALCCIPQNTGEVQFTHHSMYYALIVVLLCSIALNHANSFVPVLHSHFFLFFQCCPGYVNTDMSSHKGMKTIDQGKKSTILSSSC